MTHRSVLHGPRFSEPHAVSNDRGFLTLGGAIIVGILLLTSYVGFRFGFPFVNGTTRAQLKICITDVKAALQNMQEERNLSGDSGTKELGWDDQRVQIIERCRALLAQVANDLRGNGTSGFGDKGRELSNLIPEAIDGFTISNKCSLEDPPVGTAGLAYGGLIRAHIPFGGTNTTALLNMTGAVSASSDNFRQGSEAFGWFGRINIPGKDSQNAAGQSSSVNVTAATPVLDRNGDPFVPIPGVSCPLGSTIQPGTGACKVTCSASKSFIWKTPPIPDIRVFLVAPRTIDLASPPPFITVVWNVHDADSISIDPDIGPVGKSGFWLPFTPIQDTTYTLTATGVRPQDTKTAQQTVKVIKSAKCSEVQTQGGDTPDTRSIDLGKPAGSFVFEFDTFVQEDQMIVSYEGSTLFNSGCVGTNGTKSVTLSYAGTSTKISVQVIPNCKGGSGTQWTYTVHCPL